MNPDLPRSPAGPYNPWAVALVLSLAPFMEVLDTTIANVSLTHIAGSLGISESESTWVLTSYFVSNSIILPISGWLSQVLGRKRFYLTCVALFTVSSVLCAFSTSIDMMIVARVLQGLGGGGLAPVAQGMLADSFPADRRGQVFAMFSFITIVAPATGPLIGGWLTDSLSWHWIFLINLPVGLVALTLSGVFISEPALLLKERAELMARGLKLDYFGLFLVAVGFSTMQIFFDKFELDDGFASPAIVALAAVGGVALSVLVVWEWQHPQPVMNFRLLKIPNFAISCVTFLVVGFLFVSSTQLLPQLAQTLLGYDALHAGMTMALGGLATISILPLAGFMLGRNVPPQWLMIGGLLGLTHSFFFDSMLSPGIGFWGLTFARVEQVICIPFIFVPISVVSFIGVPPKNNGEASALINQMRNVGGGAGISFVTTLLAWRTQFHHARLAESITPYGSLHGLSVSQIAPLVQQQAAFISYLDVFRVGGFIALAAWPIVLFLKAPPRRAA